MKILQNLSSTNCRYFVAVWNKSWPAGSVQVRKLSLRIRANYDDIGKNQLRQIQPENWDLYASVCIERKPVISQELTPLEKKYKEFLDRYELEASKKSDHERRHENDKILLEKIKKGELDVGTVVTAQDFEDTSTAEALKYLPAARTTAADKVNDIKSLQRALDSHLLLLVEQEIGQDYKWVCPLRKRTGNETLRQVVDTLLETSFPNINVQVLGNAPWGFYKYRFPAEVKKTLTQSVVGAKIFFYKANYISGEFNPISSPTSSDKKLADNFTKVKDFAWMTRSELKDKLVPAYHRSVSQFLIDDDVNNNLAANS